MISAARWFTSAHAWGCDPDLCSALLDVPEHVDVTDPATWTRHQCITYVESVTTIRATGATWMRPLDSLRDLARIIRDNLD